MPIAMMQEFGMKKENHQEEGCIITRNNTEDATQIEATDGWPGTIEEQRLGIG
jgi:hypothetical protein